MLFSKLVTAKTKAPPGMSNIEVYVADTKKIRVIKSLDDTEKWGKLVHVSVSHKDRYPTWDEISCVRKYFFDENVDVMMVMPKEADYVNLHKNCFHMWVIPQEWGIR